MTALAVNDALRLGTRGVVAGARSVRTYQAAAIALALETLAAILAEQGIDQAATATVVPGSLLTGVQPTATMLGQVDSAASAARVVGSLVRDAGRTARATDMATRPAVTGYVRSLSPPSCSRCAILAGQVYRYSTGFERHTGCDCLMTPTSDAIGKDLVTDPMQAFRDGQIRNSRIDKTTGERVYSPGFSKADAQAIRDGADMAQVVNVRRKAAGLTVGSSVMVRAGRLTPQGCLMFGADRAGALSLLHKYGYLT